MNCAKHDKLWRQHKTAKLYPCDLAHSPLKALLLLPLLAYLGELPLIVLPCAALLGLAARVVLHALHLLLPGLHQLIIALADLLFLRGTKAKLGSERSNIMACGERQSIVLVQVSTSNLKHTGV